LEIGSKNAERSTGAAETPAVERWFLDEIFPLESLLMHFLRLNWRNRAEIEDIRQEVYLKVYEAAQKEIPNQPKAFLLRTAHNLLVNRVKREQIVPIEAVADLDEIDVAIEIPGPEHTAIARDILRRLQAALDRLPPRCREVVVLRRLEGLSRPDIAQRMGISPDTVSEHLANGMYVLAELLYGEAELGRGHD
jgi:RNA polymerase sigma factor (sigma-70 family)